MRWMREKHPASISELEAEYPQRFYPFFEWYETQQPAGTAMLVGLRSKESMHRFRAVTSNAGYQGVSWSTRTKRDGVFRFYPIYDWTFGDVWKYISDNNVPYNKHYDRMFARHGINISRMRVSNLIHEKSFRSLVDLQEFEPETYDRLVARLRGVHCAALYGTEDFIYNARQLPTVFASFREYRDYLLWTTPMAQRERFAARFKRQAKDEETYRMQCRQVLTNDWENNVPVRPTRRDALKDRWWDLL